MRQAISAAAAAAASTAVDPAVRSGRPLMADGAGTSSPETACRRARTGESRWTCRGRIRTSSTRKSRLGRRARRAPPAPSIRARRQRRRRLGRYRREGQVGQVGRSKHLAAAAADRRSTGATTADRHTDTSVPAEAPRCGRRLRDGHPLGSTQNAAASSAPTTKVRPGR